MKESFWAAYVIVFGVIVITFMFAIQSITNTDEHNMAVLKETTEAAMYDAFDYYTYRNTGEIKINREKFVENFLRRFSESASLSRTYRIQIYDVNEYPPKVSIKVSTNQSVSLFTNKETERVNFTISNRLDAILETPY